MYHTSRKRVLVTGDFGSCTVPAFTSSLTVTGELSPEMSYFGLVGASTPFGKVESYRLDRQYLKGGSLMFPWKLKGCAFPLHLKFRVWFPLRALQPPLNQGFLPCGTDKPLPTLKLTSLLDEAAETGDLNIICKARTPGLLWLGIVRSTFFELLYENPKLPRN
jgi:hypothetical protein